MDIGPLHGGGLNLGYRCSSKCRHCLYGAGPTRRDGEFGDSLALEALLDELAQRGPSASYHIGGGEPFLFDAKLRQAIDGFSRRGLRLEYVETNATWARSPDQVTRKLKELADLGLPQILVSLSPFHAEFVPPSRTMTLVTIAQRVLPGGALVWIPDFLPELSAGNMTACLDLDGLIARRGSQFALELAGRYGLVPGGRAGRFLHAQGLRRPWRDVLNAPSCRHRLESTTHFHVDGDGWYVPGLCAGIALRLDEVPGKIDLSNRPILAALSHGGPAALVELARAKGFSPAKTYSSACDLCTHVRAFFYRNSESAEGSELRPSGFYEAFALKAYGL